MGWEFTSCAINFKIIFKHRGLKTSDFKPLKHNQ